MNVLQILPSLDIGGVETGTVDLAGYLAAGGNKAVVISSGGRLVKELEASGGRHYTHPVGEKRTNDWLLYDLHGNVYEWIQDWYVIDYYQWSPRESPTGPETGSSRVIRGGS